METATATYTSQNPILSPRMYWRVSAFALAAVAGLGIVLSIATSGSFIQGFLQFDWTHNILHVVLAAVAFVFGFAPVSGTLSKSFAILFGAVYASLGVLGFFVADLGIMHLELGENLVHLLLGAWALVAGLMA